MEVSLSCILIASCAPNLISLMCKMHENNYCELVCAHLSLKGRTLTATVTHESSPSSSGIVPWGTMTLGIMGLSLLLAPVTASWLMPRLLLRSSLRVVRLVFEVKEDALVLDLSKDDVGLLVDGTLGSCRRFFKPGLPPESADILRTPSAYNVSVDALSTRHEAAFNTLFMASTFQIW